MLPWSSSLEISMSHGRMRHSCSLQWAAPPGKQPPPLSEQRGKPGPWGSEPEEFRMYSPSWVSCFPEPKGLPTPAFLWPLWGVTVPQQASHTDLASFPTWTISYPQPPPISIPSLFTCSFLWMEKSGIVLPILTFCPERHRWRNTSLLSNYFDTSHIWGEKWRHYQFLGLLYFSTIGSLLLGLNYWNCQQQSCQVSQENCTRYS